MEAAKYISKIFLAGVLFAGQPDKGSAESLDPLAYQHVTFKEIPATVYEKSSEGLKISVKKSSSFLFRAFENPVDISQVECSWRMTVTKPIPENPAASRKQKSGDDFPLRIGLMLSGRAPTIPFFASAWIKAVEKYSKHPSDQLLYLTAGAPFPAGTSWMSPFSNSIENITFTDVASTDGWIKSSYLTTKPRKIVGIWIMSDGDNSGAEFTIDLRELTLKP